MSLDSRLQTYQSSNDEEMLILCLSYFIATVLPSTNYLVFTEFPINFHLRDSLTVLSKNFTKP